MKRTKITEVEETEEAEEVEETSQPRHLKIVVEDEDTGEVLDIARNIRSTIIMSERDVVNNDESAIVNIITMGNRNGVLNLAAHGPESLRTVVERSGFPLQKFRKMNREEGLDTEI